MVRNVGDSAPREVRAPERPVDLAECRGVLEPTEAGEHGMEKVQEHVRDLLIIVQQAFVPLLTCTPMPMSVLEEGEEGLQVLAPLAIVFVNRWSLQAVMTPVPKTSGKLASPLTQDVKF